MNNQTAKQAYEIMLSLIVCYCRAVLICFLRDNDAHPFMYSYEYDANGNITSITQGSTSVTYEYNAANELTRENNGFTNQTVT